jgi:NAD(P)-dependent dehydrogenase (short-subunit alcohol dehydrogenase family)
VVTGASSGIGEATALRLADAGFAVFAGVRREEDAERLRSRGVPPVRLDVRDAAQVAAAAEEVRGALGPAGLVALVNNAGVVVPGALEVVPLGLFREQLEVNVIGQLAVIQAFLPLLRETGGRIVNIGSIDGRVATPLLGPYVASKFALEGMSDALRRELRPWGIQVTVIEPGAIRTGIWEKGRAAGDAILERASAEAKRNYGPLVQQLRAESVKSEQQRSLQPDAVAEVVERALTARRAPTRCLVGRDARVRALLSWLLPDRAMDALIAQFLRP